MDIKHIRGWGAAVTFLAGIVSSVCAQDKLPLRIATNGSLVELSWPARWSVPAGVKLNATHQIQRSRDLRTWETIGDPIPGWTGSTGDRLTFATDRQGSLAFYRLGTVVGQAEFATNGMLGAEVLGYADDFDQNLKRLGQISPAQFAALYPAPTNYLSQLSWDPMTASMWTNFQAPTNFSLDAAESAVFKTNGFVVSERQGAVSCGELYYRVFTGDLPVFVSTDSILEAWHRSYLSVLEELEDVYLSRSLEKILDGMAARIPAVWQQSGSGVLADSILDADYYLTVARSLLAGTNQFSTLNQEARVRETMRAITNLATTEIFLFGTNRWVDFSQFKVRGHYEKSVRLQRYFQAMMWCGRIDMRVAGNPDLSSLRELGTAIVLGDLLNKSGQFEAWRQFDQTLTAFVGSADSMNFGQLQDLLAAADIHSLADISTLDRLRQLQWDIVTGKLGFQNIRGEFYDTPAFSPEQLQLPSSFTVLGRRFVLDSWTFSQVVYDSIRWDAPGDLILQGKVDRRIPSALDTAFAVFGNNQIVPELYARMINPKGRKFRDGLPYQHNLAAAREVIDHQNAAAWDANIYMGWLAALRSLSEPTTDSRYPECMRTRAWAMKTLNTQLASWTELRHDTILYAKPSYTGAILCSYPTGFVEPRPEFWQRMQMMATNAAKLISQLSFTGQVPVRVLIDPKAPFDTWVDLPTLKRNYVAFFQQFANRMNTLRGISEKELTQTPLAANETAFIKSLMEDLSSGPYNGYTEYSGWYPNLFYMNVFSQSEFVYLHTHGAGKWVSVVTDVHTDTKDLILGDPGCVLHEAVGKVHLLLVAIDNGPDRMVYAGPVLSHYEFEMPVDVRKTDAEWKNDIRYGRMPPHPEWTKPFLVPGTFTFPSWFYD